MSLWKSCLILNITKDNSKIIVYWGTTINYCPL